MYIFKNEQDSKLPSEKVTHNSSIATKNLLPILKITHGEFVNIKKERDLLFINNKSHNIKDCYLKDVVDILTTQGIDCLIVNNTKYLNIPVSFILDFNNISSTVIPIFKSPFDISTLPFSNKFIKVIAKFDSYRTFNQTGEIVNRLEDDLLYCNVSSNTSLIITETATEYLVYLNLSSMLNYNNGHLNNSKMDNLNTINAYHYFDWSIWWFHTYLEAYL